MSIPIKKQMVFYFTKKVAGLLRREAKFQNRSMNAQITHILECHYGIRRDIAEVNPELPDAPVYTDD
jgi:hypothetical protein